MLLRNKLSCIFLFLPTLFRVKTVSIIHVTIFKQHLNFISAGKNFKENHPQAQRPLLFSVRGAHTTFKPQTPSSWNKAQD